MNWTLSLVMGLIGLFAGSIISVLASDLPARVTPGGSDCPHCGHSFGPTRGSALGQRLAGTPCARCGRPAYRRSVAVEIGTALTFVLLALFIEPMVDLVIYSIYSAILILIIVIDLEHRLILHVVTIPSTIFALLASFLLTDQNILLSITGAAAGFAIFFVLYFVGNRLFGYGALGFGDVTLSMTMGAMLGLQRILFALVIGILLAGLFSLVAIFSRRMNLKSYFAYGPFLAAAGIITIIWGGILMDRLLVQ